MKQTKMSLCWINRSKKSKVAPIVEKSVRQENYDDSINDIDHFFSPELVDNAKNSLNDRKKLKIFNRSEESSAEHDIYQSNFDSSVYSIRRFLNEDSKQMN